MPGANRVPGANGGDPLHGTARVGRVHLSGGLTQFGRRVGTAAVEGQPGEEPDCARAGADSRAPRALACLDAGVLDDLVQQPAGLGRCSAGFASTTPGSAGRPR